MSGWPACNRHQQEHMKLARSASMLNVRVACVQQASAGAHETCHMQPALHIGHAPGKRTS
eukprot:1142405-Pelagomonas_calceolata.AAC.4